MRLVAVWAGWAWIALHGNSTLATIALLVVTLAIGILYFGRVMKAVSSRDAKETDAESIGQ
ncbi:MAG: hypothetical protein JO362_00305 [Streptomycetaceae bacterium]|nr:hypothetical protein [Streptomycetaceae bacterium]